MMGRPAGRRRMARRLGAALVGVTAAAALLPATAGPAAGATVPTPQSDAFYQAPSPLPVATPGTVLRSRPVTIAFLGIAVPVQAWQLMYRSTDAQGQPAVDIATVVEPTGPAPAGGRPLVSYQAAEDSLSQVCSPSYGMRLGLEKEESLMALALLQGWALVVPDYEGLQSEWTAGAQEGHAVLDGVRAAEGFQPAGLAGAATAVGLWGYSGGGQASAWASELQPAYAPEVHLAGVAEGGVPVNVGDVADLVDGTAFSGIYLAAAVGLSRAYPQMNINSILNPAGRAMVADIGTQCILTFAPLYAFQRIEQYTVGGVNPLNLFPVQAVITTDALGQARPAGPLYIYQSVNDELVGHTDVDALVHHYCSQGVTVDYDRDVLSEHIILAVTGAPGAVAYLADRFAGKPAPSTC